MDVQNKLLSPRPQLSVCLIVKDEEYWLPKCLNSIEQIADEIIVVDTGSRDQTCSIAKQYNAKIFSFDWQDDFSAARNFSLEQATGDWILILDADEVIAECDQTILRKLTACPSPTPKAYQLLTRNYINRNDIIGWKANDNTYPEEERGCGWIPSLKTRLWSNNSEIYFSYPVHELVTPSLDKIGIKSQPCSIIVHHYGKLDQLKADTKGEKYYRLGLKKMKEMEKDGAVLPLRELAIQAGILKHYTEAIDLWQRVLQLDNNNAEAHLNLGTALFATNKIKQALQAAIKATQLNPNLKEGFFNCALYELHLGHPASAAKILNKLLLQTPEYQAAKFIHAAALCCTKSIKQGKQAFNKIESETITQEMINIAGKELAGTLTKAGRRKYAKMIKKATSN